MKRTFTEDPTSQDVRNMDDDNGEDFEITVSENGRFSTTFHVSQQYFGSIIGKKAMTKRRIESDTRTEIRIPKHRQDGNIIVLGSTIANVKAARRKINMIVMLTRAREKPTHFVSIPLNATDITTAFNKFKEEVVDEKYDRGVEQAMFTTAAKLHLTICVMCLMDNEERLVASKLLTEAKEKIIMPALECGPLRMRLKGVSFMGENPREVSVLYGLVDMTDPHTARLQNLADQVYRLFLDAGIAKRDHGRDTVKLHMTLAKSINAIKKEDGTLLGRKKSFDASSILQKYADYEFGVQELKEIHLSQMHNAAKPEEYYPATCVVTCTDDRLYVCE